MEVALICVYPAARTTPAPAPLASERSTAMPVPRVSGLGRPASVRYLSGPLEQQRGELEGLLVQERVRLLEEPMTDCRGWGGSRTRQ